MIFQQDGVGTANTALVHHAGQLLALQEGDTPYALGIEGDTGVVSTLGRKTYGGEQWHVVVWEWAHTPI